MKHSTKVKKFVACILATKTAYAACSLAKAKYGLNAAYFEDQAAWWEAVALCGSPYSTNDDD
jgi:hypothetical protein